MGKFARIAAATALGIGVLSLTPSAQAGGGSAIGLVAGFGIGAILGSYFAPTEVYVGPPPPYYYYGPPVYGLPPPPNWYANRTYRHSTTPPHVDADGQRPASARSTAVKTEEVPDPIEGEAKLKAAQAKAAKLGGVQKLTSEDVDGLSREQLKRLRGY
jgi:hypothetical protein